MLFMQITCTQKELVKIFLRNVGEDHALYVQSNILLLADVFNNFWDMGLKYMGLILLIFFLHEDYHGIQS